MLEIAICDDESANRTALKELLVPWLELQNISYLIYEFDCGESLIAGYQQNRCDLIFLDIEMPGLDGVETAKRLREMDSYGILIFVTAYPDFVFQGYEVRAFHYILKPYEKKKILEITSRAIREIQDRNKDYYLIPVGSQTLRLDLKETLYFYSERRKITAVTASRDSDSQQPVCHTFYGKLDDLEQEMPDYFCRVHQRYLVNLKQVSSTQDNHLTISGQSLPVSRAHRQEFLISFANTMLKEG